ncbi:MAG: hypothetical protein V4543_11960 [Bacteroidota bacterium]
MAKSNNGPLTISADLQKVLRAIPAHKLDEFLRASFPEVFDTEEEKVQIAENLRKIDEFFNKPAPIPVMSYEEAIKNTRSGR